MVVFLENSPATPFKDYVTLTAGYSAKKAQHFGGSLPFLRISDPSKCLKVAMDTTNPFVR